MSNPRKTFENTQLLTKFVYILALKLGFVVWNDHFKNAETSNDVFPQKCPNIRIRNIDQRLSLYLFCEVICRHEQKFSGTDCSKKHTKYV